MVAPMPVVDPFVQIVIKLLVIRRGVYRKSIGLEGQHEVGV